MYLAQKTWEFKDMKMDVDTKMPSCWPIVWHWLAYEEFLGCSISRAQQSTAMS